MAFDSRPLRDVDALFLFVSSLGAVGVIAAAFLVANVVGVAMLLLAGVESVEAVQGQPMLYAAFSAATSSGFVFASLGYLALRDEWDLIYVRRPTLRDAGFVVVGFVALGVASYGMTALVSALVDLLHSLFGVGTEMGQNSVVTTGRRNPRAFLYLIPVALFVVGPGEELLFRGVVQGLFRRALGAVPAIVLASACFGLGHYFSVSTGNAWTYLFIAGAMGLVLGALYEYTENIAVPAAVHGVWNAFLFALNWALVTYDVPLAV